jgi:DNA-binding NtrC family response regulator
MKAVRALLLSSESGEDLCAGLKEILQQHLPKHSILTTETLPCRDGHPSYNVTRRPAVNRDLDILFIIMKQIERDQVAAAVRSVVADSPLLPAVLVLESCDPADVLELLRLGISDFVTSPFRPVDVVPRVLRLLDQTCLKREPVMAIKEKLGLKQIVGECPAFVSVISQFPMVAGCDASVLLLGETGTGKELCARAIHYLSPRARKPFTPVNCGAIPSELVENELFGHESEAFTGASSRRTGLIQETDGGTLFLDEIDCLPLLAQVKLLRFLQDREYRPLGAGRNSHADVRVLAASNGDLAEAVSTGRLRRDFYYRLNTIQLLLPPLREREADIPLLAEHFLRKYSDRFGKRIARYSAAAMRMLTRYSWPGNVRELEHVIERAVVMTEGLIVAQDSISVPADGGSEPAESFRDRKARMVAEFEKSYIEDLLKDSEGNITRAAEAARKDRRALRLLIRKHKIDVKTFKAASK